MQPTRKIGKSHSALRAVHPSVKNGRVVQLESALERDFCCLLEFERDITSYVEQPVAIDYVLNGRSHRYTPDFLIHYVGEKPGVLAEIKYRADLRAHWAQLKPKFRAAKRYASAQGWEFRLYTEAEIQTPYLDNVKFLLCFRAPASALRREYAQLLLEAMAQLDESTPAEILLVAFQDADRRAELLPVLWHLVSSGQIGCNLFQPLTMRSPVWSIDGHLSLPDHGQN
ncbi:heteromeric transposase endonuclease subunit TnsA [Hymenobacter coccineus]|uniref:Heteromeric transposase endonuclease subunit TnsA n=1 Tax=Hymenobacter coccineus TaxID=1908235 RepID=A0A1G1TKW0_9BACT|nr:heteromeric transposase endonuclease subunit TnsA [Hymenobacter coccineus]OGX91501.1 hypothetical protein BEN49_04830 [Hymenobacter coccineus]